MVELELLRVQGGLGEFDIQRVLPPDPQKASLFNNLARLVYDERQYRRELSSQDLRGTSVVIGSK
ncbi:unnamed protein product [Ectocarpus sp. 12 AP-2014]